MQKRRRIPVHDAPPLRDRPNRSNRLKAYCENFNRGQAGYLDRQQRIVEIRRRYRLKYGQDFD